MRVRDVGAELLDCKLLDSKLMDMELTSQAGAKSGDGEF
jgi:hypothetical protein